MFLVPNLCLGTRKPDSLRLEFEVYFFALG